MPALASAEPALALEVVSGLPALEELREAWIELWRACDATPFQHPAWLLPWARVHAPERTHAVTLRDRGALVAVLPVFSWRGTLYLAGAGPSDYASALFAPGAQAAASDLLGRAADLARELSCPIIDLPQLLPGDPLAGARAPNGWTTCVEAGETCPVAQLTGDDGLAGVPKLWRRKLAYAHRKTARASDFEVVEADVYTLEEIWSALAAAHAARWRARGEPGVLADDLLLRFLSEAVPELLRDGLLRLYGLRLEGRVAAGLLALQDDRRVHGYLTGFDPEHAALGLGSILIGHTVSEAHRSGRTEMHFLRGQEPYKYNWGAKDRPTYRRVLTRT